MMHETQQNLQRVVDISQQLVPVSCGRFNSKVLVMLSARANLLDELGEPYEAQVDRLSARFIRQHPDNSHLHLCCKTRGGDKS